MAYNPYYFSDSGSEDSSSLQDVEMRTEYSKSTQSASDVSFAGPSEPHNAVSSSAASSVPFPAFSAQNSDGSSQTSYERSSGSRTSSPDNSVISLSESIRQHMYREEYGRDMNNYSEVYRMPADDEEWDRQEKQHRMFIDIFGTKYPPPMGLILQSTIPREKKVLDLGCGNGAWIIDVARDFPFCEAVAVDLVPLPHTEGLPPNLRSEIDDINMGLQHFFGQFDVVNARLVSVGIRNYRLFIEHISRILRPGGLIQLAEYDVSGYDRLRKRIPVSTDGPLGPPWWARLMAEINRAVRISGGDADAATHLHDWISTHEAFENVVYRDVWLPVVPGNDQMYHEDVYTRLRANVTSGVRASRPLLLGTGLSPEDFDVLESNATREINESLVSKYTRLQCVYATKRHGVVLPDLDDIDIS